ncbi:MAG: RNA-binding protein [Bacillota bacterium]
MGAVELQAGQLVRSRGGRDRDRNFIVLKTLGDSFVHLVDGDLRKIEKPKKKNVKHLQVSMKMSTKVRDIILSGQLPTNAEIREAIRDLDTEVNE